MPINYVSIETNTIANDFNVLKEACNNYKAFHQETKKTIRNKKN